MTEFEAATIALQEASIVARQAATTAAYIVGIVQCLLIAVGLFLMWRTTSERDAHHADRRTETMCALEQQHTATMRALEALIERTAPRGTP